MCPKVLSRVARAVVAMTILLPGLAVDPPRARAAETPCGENQPFPGPGRYVGAFKGTLASQFTDPDSVAEFAVPLNGTLELQFDEAGNVGGQAKLTVADLPEVRALPIKASFDLTAGIQGQLSEPLERADVPVKAMVDAAAFGASGNKLIGWSGSLNLHLRDFQKDACAGLHGTWELEGSHSAQAENWDIKDAQWSTNLDGFDQNLDESIRAAVNQMAGLSPVEALALKPSLSTAEADPLMDALGGGAAGLPSGGLFGVYQRVVSSPGPPAQIRCLAALVQTAIATKLQEYQSAVAIGANPTYEEVARLGYALRVGQGVDSGIKCPTYAMGLGALRVMIQVTMNDAMGGGDQERVARLTRLARAFELGDVGKRGADWLLEKGYAL